MLVAIHQSGILNFEANTSVGAFSSTDSEINSSERFGHENCSVGRHDT